jgi:large subunit ribosomal protein L14
MIQSGTILRVTDKTGVVLVQCIKVFGPYKKKIAYLGDIVLVTVKRINPKKFRFTKFFKKKKFFKGTLHRGLVIRAKYNYCRMPGVFVRFNENTIVIVINVLFPYPIEYMGQFLRNFVCVFHR